MGKGQDTDAPEDEGMEDTERPGHTHHRKPEREEGEAQETALGRIGGSLDLSGARTKTRKPIQSGDEAPRTFTELL